jgi:hypothetical protein
MIYLISLFFSPISFDAYMLPKLWLISLCLLFLKSEFQTTRLNYLLLAFIAMAVCAAFRSNYWLLNLIGHYNGYLGSVMAMALLWLAYNSRYGQGRAVRQVVRSSAIIGVICLIQLKFPGPHNQFIQNNRPIGTIGNPVFCAAYLAMGFSLATNWLAIPILLGILAMKARAALIACFAVFLYRNSKSLSKRMLIFCSTVFLAGITIYSLKYSSFSDIGRIEIWKVAFKLFKEHPILGIGSEQFFIRFTELRSQIFIDHFIQWVIQDYAHNDFLHVLSSWGIIGLCLYILIWLQLVSAAKKNTYLIPPLIAIFICSKFNAITAATIFCLALLFPRENSKLKIPLWPAKLFLFLLISKLYIADIFYRQSNNAINSERIKLIFVAQHLRPGEPQYYFIPNLEIKPRDR